MTDKKKFFQLKTKIDIDDMISLRSKYGHGRAGSHAMRRAVRECIMDEGLRKQMAVDLSPVYIPFVIVMQPEIIAELERLAQNNNTTRSFVLRRIIEALARKV